MSDLEIKTNATINELVRAAYAQARKNGFYDDDVATNPIAKLMLVVTELAEATEVVRNDHASLNSQFIADMHFVIGDDDALEFEKHVDATAYKDWFEAYVKDTFSDELADAVIRLFDLCGQFGINLEDAIISKMLYNTTREYRHGKTC